MTTSVGEIIERIQTFAESRRDILAIYLFGSILTKDIPHDIDVAVVVDPEMTDCDRQPFGYGAGLNTDFVALLHRNEVDVVLLDHAPPLLCMEVLRKGKLVYSRKEYDRIRHEKRMKDRYIDTAPLRRIKEHYLRMRYLGRDSLVSRE